MIVRPEALKLLAKLRTDEIVITTMSTLKEWKVITNNYDLDFPVIGAMSQAPCVGLGLALTHPERRVWVLNGDGSQLMNLGTMATIINSGVKNLVLFVFENGVYELTGGQPIPLAGRVDFAATARSVGFTRAYTFDDFAAFESSIPGILKGEGPTFVDLKVVPGERYASWIPPRVQEAIKLREALKP